MYVQYTCSNDIGSRLKHRDLLRHLVNFNNTHSFGFEFH